MADRSMRSMAHVECRAILRALASTDEIHASVHEARKAIRRLRALLALVADARWDDIDHVDRELQALGDGLSALRDAHVAVGTAQGLGQEAVVALLVARRDALAQRALADDVDFRRRREAAAHIDGMLDDLPWESLTPDVLRAGLQRSRRRVTKAKKRAKSDPSLDNLHRWRRRARRLRMQLTAMGQETKDLHAIGDRLGALQDLRMLRNLLRQVPDLLQGHELMLQLRKRIASRKARIVD